MDVRQIAVPHHVGVFGQGNRQRFDLGLDRVEQAQLDASGVFRKDCEVDADAVPRRPQGVRRARPDSKATLGHKSR